MCIPVKVTLIFLRAPLNPHGAPGNIQGITGQVYKWMCVCASCVCVCVWWGWGWGIIQSEGVYTWYVLSGKIHGGIRNIQCKSRLWGPLHRGTIAPRKNIFLTRVLRVHVLSVSRVPVHIYEGTCGGGSHFCGISIMITDGLLHIWPPGHLQLHCSPSSGCCNHIRWNEWFCLAKLVPVFDQIWTFMH